MDNTLLPVLEENPGGKKLAIVGIIVALGGLFWFLTKKAAAAETRYECPICGAKFGTLAEKNIHMWTVHPDMQWCSTEGVWIPKSEWTQMRCLAIMPPIPPEPPITGRIS